MYVILHFYIIGFSSFLEEVKVFQTFPPTTLLVSGFVALQVVSHIGRGKSAYLCLHVKVMVMLSGVLNTIIIQQNIFAQCYCKGKKRVSQKYNSFKGQLGWMATWQPQIGTQLLTWIVLLYADDGPLDLIYG